MATYNNTSSTNNINPVTYSHSKTIEYYTDRKVTGVALHAIIERIQGLTNIKTTNPFTNKTS
jgi:hypothetical protein